MALTKVWNRNIGFGSQCRGQTGSRWVATRGPSRNLTHAQKTIKCEASPAIFFPILPPSPNSPLCILPHLLLLPLLLLWRPVFFLFRWAWPIFLYFWCCKNLLFFFFSLDFSGEHSFFFFCCCCLEFELYFGRFGVTEKSHEKWRRY